jgi:glycosyltransferase involved in cell wall biosynthesis
MDIGIIGYYGFGNIGDEAIFDNLRLALAPHHLIPIQVGFAANSATLQRLNALDFLILGGGGLYQNAPPSPFGSYDEWAGHLKTPFGILGLGVARLDPRFRVATHRLIDNSLFFLVRDEESKQILDHPKVQVGPDLTFYRPLQVEAGDRSEGQIICGVNIRPAHAGVSEWVRAVRALPCTKRAIPLSVHPALGDHEVLLELDADCPSRFSPNEYASIDLLVGTAFHSIAFAIQTGTPVVAINYDPKVQRLMQEVGLTQYLLEWNQWDRLLPCYEKLLADQDVVRRRMLAYTAQAQEKMHRIMHDLRQLLDDSARKKSAVTLKRDTKTKVSIIVRGQDATEGDVRRTISSCLNQTHGDLEVILLNGSSQMKIFDEWPGDDPRLRQLKLDGGPLDWLTTGLEATSGEYVTWLEAGAWFTDDAVSVLLGALKGDPEADLAHSDYFLTSTGIVERKVRLNRPYAPDKANTLGPCLLVRRGMAKKVWNQIKGKVVTPLPRNCRAIYVGNPLFFKPSSDSQRNFYRGLVSYGRGNISAGGRLLSSAAANSDGRIEDWAQVHDIVELLATIARNAPIARNPEQFVETVFHNLPEEAKGLHPLKRRVLAHLAMRQFFETHHVRAWSETLRTAWKGISNDPAWLRNRGVWVILFRSFITTLLPANVRHRHRQATAGGDNFAPSK